MKIQKIFISIILFLDLFTFFSQIPDSLDVGFFKYLDEKKLFEQKLQYLEVLLYSNKAPINYILSEKAKVNFGFRKYDVVIRNIEDHRLLDDSICFNALMPIYLRSKMEYGHELKISNAFIIKMDSVMKDLHKMTSFVSPHNMSFKVSDVSLKESYDRYYHVMKSRGLLLTSFSIMIPGWGKWYLGKRYDALGAFMGVAVLGLQAGEAYHKRGLYDWRTILFGGMSISFYSANIYGTLKALKKERQDRKIEFLKNVDENYFEDYIRVSAHH